MFIDEAPDVDFDDKGFAHVVDRSGTLTIERVMSQHTLIVYLKNGRRALAELQRRQAASGET